MVEAWDERRVRKDGSAARRKRRRLVIPVGEQNGQRERVAGVLALSGRKIYFLFRGERVPHSRSRAAAPERRTAEIFPG